MKKQDFTATLSIPKHADEVFAAINDVRSWWTGEITGRADAVGAEFTYRYRDMHRTTHRVTELVPGKRVVWHVTEAELPKFADPKEWAGTDIVFELTPHGDRTDVRFTHVGLVPTVECYDACSRGWTWLLTENLKKRALLGAGAVTAGTEFRG
jgi:uncharacterized protein YndB with AHSA1/START domain